MRRGRSPAGEALGVSPPVLGLCCQGARTDLGPAPCSQAILLLMGWLGWQPPWEDDRDRDLGEAYAF